jgi:methionine-rich copper-binding protein CopC
MARMSRRVVAFLVLAIAGALLVPAIGVFAHAGYDHSTPSAGEVVTTPPTKVDAYFKEDIKRAAGTYSLRVEDATGTAVSDGDGTLDDNDRTHMTATIPTTLADGRYVVKYKTVSDVDGDAAQGGFCFYVNVQPSAADTAACTALVPTEAPASTGSPVATTQATSVATSAATPEASPTVATATGNKDNGSNTGVIVGVIVGIVVAVVVVAGGALYMRQRQQG